MKAKKAQRGDEGNLKKKYGRRRALLPALALALFVTIGLLVMSSPTRTAAQPDSGLLWERVGGSGITYRSISMVSPTEGWAVGSDLGLSHWDGTQWTDYPAQYLVDYPSLVSSDFTSVSAFDASHAWVVGDGGMNYYWDGASWTRGYITATATAELNGVAMVSQNEAWAIE